MYSSFLKKYLYNRYWQINCPLPVKGFSVEKHLDQDIEALIVEDENDICFLLTGILRKKNLQTTFVNNIREAEIILNTKHPSLLFLDNNLPDGCGVDFIHQIKNNHPLTRIIMITADDTIANKNKALAAGADIFIGKPFTRDTINETIDNLMSENVH
ncbi:MAG: response regulator [Chitinophagaceae bacterium]|nr:response regulator [Chitinophagaceae bacterium]